MRSMSLKSSAPGKVIFFGEHAVVYPHKTAIATSLGLRTEASWELSENIGENEADIDLLLPDLDLEFHLNATDHLRIGKHESLYNIKVEEPVACTVEFLEFIKSHTKSLHDNKLNGVLAFLYLYFAISRTNKSPKKLSVRVKSTLPVGMGLGSSASYCVSLAAGLLYLFHYRGDQPSSVNLDYEKQKLINGWAFQAEKIIHGTPSGIDNTVGTFGGTLTLTKDDNGAMNIVHLKEPPSLHLLLTNTKQPRNTHELVSKVRVFKQEHPEEANEILNRIHGVSTKCVAMFDAHKDGKLNVVDLHNELEVLMDENQNLLDKVGVNHRVLDVVCSITKKFGLHSKLTGAGGGGCAITLLRPDTMKSVVEDVTRELQAQGFECFQVEIGGQGVQWYS